jgi:hypothetical protein
MCNTKSIWRTIVVKKTNKRGRPPSGEFSGRSVVGNFRMRPETKALLEKAAQASGRTVSQEFEHRLLRGLDDFEDEPTTAVMKIFDLTMDTVSKAYDPTGKAKWWSDPLIFVVAERALTGIFHMLRPPGAVPVANKPPGAESTADHIFFQQMKDMGAYTAASVFQRIQLVDETKPYARLSKPEVWYSMLRKELGPLADRPVIYGQTGEELRAEHAKLDAIRPLYQQIRPLQDIPEDERTPEQKKKLERLQRQLREIETGGKSS